MFLSSGKKCWGVHAFLGAVLLLFLCPHTKSGIRMRLRIPVLAHVAFQVPKAIVEWSVWLPSVSVSLFRLSAHRSDSRFVPSQFTLYLPDCFETTIHRTAVFSFSRSPPVCKTMMALCTFSPVDTPATCWNPPAPSLHSIHPMPLTSVRDAKSCQQLSAASLFMHKAKSSPICTGRGHPHHADRRCLF